MIPLCIVTSFVPIIELILAFLTAYMCVGTLGSPLNQFLLVPSLINELNKTSDMCDFF